MHKNFFSFKASNHFYLGVAIGKQFAPQAREALTATLLDKDWALKKETARQMISFAQRYFPHYIEELKGYAQGAEVNFDDFWTISLEDDAFVRRRGMAKCTTIINKNGLLIGHNEDYFAPGFEKTICIVKKTIGNFSTLEIFYYNTVGGSSIGVNSHGFVHAINTLLYTSKEVGVPKSMIARSLLDTQDPVQDLAIAESVPRASGFSHIIIGDHSQIWNAEFTNRTAHIEIPTLPFVHTNHCLINKSGISLRDSYGTSSRLKTARQKANQVESETQLVEVLNDTSKGTYRSLHNERTIGKMIVNLKTKKSKIWLLREAELGWVTYDLPF